MELCDIKRHVRPENISKRHCSFKYNLAFNGKRYDVCQKTICAIYCVTPRRIQLLQEKLKNGHSTEDKRGKHFNRPHKIQQNLRNMIIEHITSFPTEESHYSRKKCTKMCLSSNLNVQKMFELFQEKFKEPKMKLHLYRDVFNENFNLRFGVPRSDTCARCDLLYTKLVNAENEEERRRIKAESEVHHRKAEKSYQTLKEDTVRSKNDPLVIVICMDLQQVLFSPTLTHSNVFYQRQFSTYNFCIHNPATKDSVMHVWHETTAKRGSAEIVSCLLSFILSHFKPLERCESRSLIIWSDRCVGQNNNFKVVTLLHHLVLWNYFSQVEQKFLCSGHSFLPCDRNFALIERQKKVARILHPFQWIELIANARPSKLFFVKLMQQSDFLDISVLEKRTTRPKEFKVTEAMWLLFKKDDPKCVSVRQSHSVLMPWKTFTLRRTIPPLTRVENLPVLYETPIPVKAEKKANLVDMCKYIEDAEARNFFLNLPTAEK